MMMGGMGMFWGALLGSFLLFGFAYILWVLGAKESGSLKVIGQIISAVIAVLALIVLLYSGIWGGLMGHADRWSHHGMGSTMMDQGGKGDMKMMMQEMMKDPQMKKMMEDCLKGK